MRILILNKDEVIETPQGFVPKGSLKPLYEYDLVVCENLILKNRIDGRTGEISRIEVLEYILKAVK